MVRDSLTLEELGSAAETDFCNAFVHASNGLHASFKLAHLMLFIPSHLLCFTFLELLFLMTGFIWIMAKYSAIVRGMHAVSSSGILVPKMIGG